MTDIRNMPAGPEMDALVADKVMHMPSWIQETANDYKGWRPSTDMAAAWDAGTATNLPMCVTQSQLKDGWTCYFLLDDDWNTVEASADTAPLAICRAALLAVQKGHDR